MNNIKNHPKLVGNLLKSKRESLGLSQKALGLLLQPSVTTQFISNVERGITPLPAGHISSISKVLHINENEIMSLLEREFAFKINSKVGKNSPLNFENFENEKSHEYLKMNVDHEDYEFINKLYTKFKSLNKDEKADFIFQINKILI